MVACAFSSSSPLAPPALLVLSCVSSREPGRAPLPTAQQSLASAVALGAPALWQEHAHAWSSVWREHGIDVQVSRVFCFFSFLVLTPRIATKGSLLVKRAVRASLAGLIQEVRQDWPLGGLSVGGAGTSGKYNGHIFSDAETWMGPPLLLFFPELVRSTLRYRLLLRAGAQDKALIRPPLCGYHVPVGERRVWERGVPRGRAHRPL